MIPPDDDLPPPPSDDDLAGMDLGAEVRAQAEDERQAFDAAQAAKAKPAPEDPGPSHQDVLEAYRLNEVGDARLFIQVSRGKLCYDTHREQWFVFNCTRWHEDELGDAADRVGHVAELYDRQGAWFEAESEKAAASEDKGMAKAYAVKAKQLRKRGADVRSARRTANILKFARSGGASLAISGSRWDREHTLLPVANGVIDLATGALIQGSPDFYLLKGAGAYLEQKDAGLPRPIEWRGLHEPAPTWDDLLHKALRGDQHLLDYFQRVIGYSATGLASFKDFYVAYGPGGDNGKSVIFETIARVLGDFAGTLPVGLLLDEGFVKSGSGPSPDIMRLRGLRMAVTSEAEQHHRFSMSKIKSIVSGGDAIVARDLQKGFESFAPTHTLWLHSNFLPRAVGNDRAFFRRCKVVPFKSRFVDPACEKPDPDNHIYPAIARAILDRRLDDESPGILAWIVRGAKAFLEGLRANPPVGLVPPPSVLAETGMYQADQDLVGRFLAYCCEVLGHREKGSQMKYLYEAFKDYCQEVEGIGEKKVLSQRRLGSDLKTRTGVEEVQSAPVVFYNVRVLDKDNWGQA